MAIMRVHKNSNYTVMSNYHFREKNMSLKAKGLLSQMLSLPDDWDYSIAGLVAINKENETSIKSALKELKQFGYLVVTKLNPSETKSGRIEYTYDIYEFPTNINQNQNVEKQGVEKQGIENLPLENQGQLNTNNKIPNNKINNIKESKKEDYNSILDELVTDSDIKKGLVEFIKMRKLIKKPMTNLALKKLINKLFKLSSSKEEQLQILDKSILNSWSDIFPLKNDNFRSNNYRSPKRQEPVPEWLDKDIKSEQISKEEKQELEELLSEFDDNKKADLERRKRALQERIKNDYGK